ncbi:glycoside hydrolase family 19 protein, partial [Pseudomonas sp. Pseusp97]|uniref:glycoside hydrolase family 19 protein n=1 Tax=Pseudomonas sp. Pseusp97 TaxID=3243065 RepID=UPI0039A43134
SLTGPRPRHPDAVSIAISAEYDGLPEGDKLRLSEQYVAERELNTARLVDSQAQGTLKRLICKFPTEWARDDFNARYDWLLKVAEGGPMSEDDFKDLKKHQEALAFWEEANLTDIESKHWRFPPKDFISHLRTCGWLSKIEMAQLLPATGLNLNYESALRNISTGNSTNTQIMPGTMWISLNKTRSKYLINTPLRTAHFWGQIVQETDGMQTVREYASGAAYEGRADLGNINPGDGVRFRGRGVIQVTGRVGYTNYQRFRRLDFTSEPNQLLLQSNSYVASDASGYYWTAEKTRDRVSNPPGSPHPYSWILDGKININTRADRVTFSTMSDIDAVRADVLNVTRQVNRAALHLDNRIRYFKHAYKDLSDDTITTLPGGNIRK